MLFLQPDIDAPASQQAPPSEGPQVVAADSTAQTTDVQHQQQHAAPEPLHRSSREDRDRRADRPTRGAAPEHDRHRDHDKYKAEQEKAEIAQELEKLTRDISFQELRRSVHVGLDQSELRTHSLRTVNLHSLLDVNPYMATDGCGAGLCKLRRPQSAGLVASTLLQHSLT